MDDQTTLFPLEAKVVDRRRAIEIELLVVIFAFVVPYFLNDLARPPQPRAGYLWLGSVGDILRFLGYLAISVLIIAESGEPFSHFGWVRLRPRRDILLALVLTLIYKAVNAGLMLGMHHTRVQILELKIHQRIEHPILVLVALPSIVLSAFVQELVYRGLIVTRLGELSGREDVAVGVGAVLFAAIHLYQGWILLPVHFLFGVITGILLVRTRSLWPGTILHSLANIVSYFSI